MNAGKMKAPPPALWAFSKEANPRPRPHAIGHRGYKALFPENTMAAFRGVVDVGADSIETDLHLSKDGVVVLSHDATLKRCYGVPKKVADCDWDYLKTLRTLREPREPMPRLVDLLEYLNQPEQAHIWVFLDIKPDDDSTQLLNAIAASIASVPPSGRPWNQRLMLGSWDAHWLAACLRILPDYPKALTAFSPSYATELLGVPDLHFNLFNMAFPTTRAGSRFIKQARQRGRLALSWTDNEDPYLARSLRDGADGVITDDPARFIALRRRWADDDADPGFKKSVAKFSARQTAFWLFINVLVVITEVLHRFTRGSPRKRVERELGTVPR
ncbi:PLC-like phosphodiesterase [Hypoxylon sp. FL1284]|nr:PLC-like phosphodiesterase [Hypoxylon sp. FL1284]